jgi:hypothetical protein
LEENVREIPVEMILGEPAASKLKEQPPSEEFIPKEDEDQEYEFEF